MCRKFCGLCFGCVDDLSLLSVLMLVLWFVMWTCQLVCSSISFSNSNDFVFPFFPVFFVVSAGANYWGKLVACSIYVVCMTFDWFFCSSNIVIALFREMCVLASLHIFLYISAVQQLDKYITDNDGQLVLSSSFCWAISFLLLVLQCTKCLIIFS